ncbi:kinase-like protein [Fomitopsis serialis]|uniref:kinase-like protein n=1 Tax=Fomitopsis serialis TaxID=139415 RepID=UPI0020082349|nr:kinase-like protein [Neoantrodia serialis]KAH9936576.1 kinase-like protein [Neoantrodia serialis]
MEPKQASHIGLPVNALWTGLLAQLARAVTDILRFELPWSIWRLLPSSFRLSCYRRLASYSHRQPFSSITHLPFGLILKEKDEDPHFEANNTQFVATRTNIPVPRILDVIEFPAADSQPGGIILMNEIEGDSLWEWVIPRIRRVPEAAALIARLEACMESNDLDPIMGIAAELEKMPRPTVDMSDDDPLVMDLRRALNELRALAPSSQAVSGLDYLPLFVNRAGEKYFMGPFADQTQFKEALFRKVSNLFKYRLPGLRGLAEPVFAKTHRIYFTHADLHHNNILVKDGRLAAILDWEHAGWYPEYWEHTAMEALTIRTYQMNAFWDQVHLFGEGAYRDELSLEWALWGSTGLMGVVGEDGDDLGCPRVPPLASDEKAQS